MFNANLYCTPTDYQGLKCIFCVVQCTFQIFPPIHFTYFGSWRITSVLLHYSWILFIQTINYEDIQIFCQITNYKFKKKHMQKNFNFQISKEKLVVLIIIYLLERLDPCNQRSLKSVNILRAFKRIFSILKRQKSI